MTTTLFIHDRFTFNINGFSAKYTYKGQTTTLTLCPAALCDLLQEAKLIEGFDFDQNGEPVILFTDPIFPAGYGGELWHQFVCTFPLSYKMAVKLLEYREERKVHRSFQAKVIHLLQPFQAA